MSRLRFSDDVAAIYDYWCHWWYADDYRLLRLRFQPKHFRFLPSRWWCADATETFSSMMMWWWRCRWWWGCRCADEDDIFKWWHFSDYAVDELKDDVADDASMMWCSWCDYAAADITLDDDIFHWWGRRWVINIFSAADVPMMMYRLISLDVAADFRWWPRLLSIIAKRRRLLWCRWGRYFDADDFDADDDDEPEDVKRPWI